MATSSEESLSLYHSDHRLSLDLKNEREYTAFQFDLYVPEGTDVTQMQLNTQRHQKHQLLYNMVEDGHYRVVALSTSNRSFNGNDGELLNISVEGLYNEEVSIRNIHFFTPDGSDYQFNDILSVTSVATEITDKDFTPLNSHLSPLYDLQGRRIGNLSPITSHPSSLKQGVYIVNGKKVVMK